MNIDNKRKKKKSIISYGSITQKDAELRLGIRLSRLVGESLDIEEMIKLDDKNLSNLKDLIFNRLADALDSEGYPEASIEPFKEIVVTDFIGEVLRPIIANFKRNENNQNIMLTREKEIISIDGQTSGNMEFIVIDTISVKKDRYMLIIEAKRDALGKGLVQCLLSLKDAYENNNDNKCVYGFVTTGIDWQLIKYNGNNDIKISNKITLLFAGLQFKKELWIKNNSYLIDIIYQIIKNTV